MGAVIGSLYAAGALDEFEAWARALKKRDVLQLIDVALAAPGTIRAERVMKVVDEMLKGATFDDLRLPFTAVAADLQNGKEVWFQQGSVIVAVRASIAIPGVFTPVMVGHRLLADGGLLNPVPMSPLTTLQADRTLAVDLGGPWMTHPVDKPVSDVAKTRKSIARSLELLRGTVEKDRDENLEQALADVPASLNTADVLLLALQATQQSVTRFQLAASPPDVLVSLPVDACGLLEFDQAPRLIDMGRAAAAQALDAAGL